MLAGGSGAYHLVRATFREIPLSGARVQWDRTVAGGAGDSSAWGVTDAEGKASFVLSPGKYFLVARWRKDGDYARPIAPGDRFAYFGGNPVYVASGAGRELFIGLEEFRDPLPAAGEPPGATGVSGHVLAGDDPVEGAHVYAYLHDGGTGFRDLGFAASAPTDGTGGFALELPPGDYFLIVRKRALGGVAGPLRKGDHFGYYPANPVSVSRGSVTRVLIPAARLKLRNIPVYSGRYASAASIEGRILGRDGGPRKGVYAALYDNPDMLNRPVFLSDVTGEDGRYRLPVPVPGTYFLGARTGYGGSPSPGDLYGRYEGNPRHSVTVKEGDHLSGIDIVVFEVW